MTRDVSGDLAGLCSLFGLGAIVVAWLWAPVAGLVVSVSMLLLLSLAFQSPAGPIARFDESELL